MDLFKLSGKVAVVAGASRGIGKAVARSLAEAGAKVVVSSRNIDDCNAVTKEILSDGGKAISCVCNIADKVQLANLVKETQTSLGVIDILVVNAATNPAYGSMMELSEAHAEKIFVTNVEAPARLINLVAPKMIEKGGGCIIIMSSIASIGGSANIGAYAISKAADAQLARNYAVELGPHNIRVNTIAPGLIKTNFSRVLWEGEKGKAFAAQTPLKRLGEPDDIAGVVNFLVSDAAKFITGQTIVVDGGVTIGGPF
jgi:dehydrogenase/reductase SDR family protein 4